MTLYKTIGVETNLEVRVKAGVDPPVLLKIASTVANRITKGTAQLLAKDAKSVAKITILKQFAKVVQIAGEIIVDKDPKIKERVRNFMKSMSKVKRSWMTWLNRCNYYFTMMCTSMQ